MSLSIWNQLLRDQRSTGLLHQGTCHSPYRTSHSVIRGPLDYCTKVHVTLHWTTAPRYMPLSTGLLHQCTCHSPYRTSYSVIRGPLDYCTKVPVTLHIEPATQVIRGPLDYCTKVHVTLHWTTAPRYIPLSTGLLHQGTCHSPYRTSHSVIRGPLDYCTKVHVTLHIEPATQ